MVKVVSFSLWGNQSKYTIGSIKNADLAKEFYPDFECWFYIHKPSVPQNIIDELAKRDNVKIFYKEGDINTSKPMMWRFEPIINQGVEVMMSRDTDTRILLREKLAVEEWLQSDKLIHIMRDHPYHNYAIQGGMWGIKQNNLCNWEEVMKNVIQTSARLYDQLFVSNIIYNIYKNSAMIHASFHKYENNAKDFPIPFCKDKKFVGEYVNQDESRIPEHYNMIK
jgi:hypothetical protein